MNSDTLCEIIHSRLDDMVERYNYLISIGDEENADLITEEGMLIADAADRDDAFLILPDFQFLN